LNYFVGFNRFKLSMKQLPILLIYLITLLACNQTTSERSKSFKHFKKHFKTIDLPITTNLLYRVHNSKLVFARIDTSFIQQFINSDYKLEVNDPVYDGYAYSIKLPKGKEQNYEGLIYYQSKEQSQFFILKTYSLDGHLVSTLPLSGDSSSYKRQTCQISEKRLIVIRDFYLHQEEKNVTEYFYEINENGLITALDTFHPNK
jgi:hypothetical protein